MRRTAHFVSALAAVVAVAACQTASVRFPNANVAGTDAAPRQIAATLVKPEGNGPFPAVVLLHTCGGVQPHVRDDWPRHLASLGYVTATVDSFGSRGLGPCPNALHTAERSPKTEAYREITRDALGALDYLAALPYVAPERIAVIGFSLGANTINSFLIHQQRRVGPNFAAAVAIYGRCHDLGRYPVPKTPLMQIAGERDTGHVESCQRVSQRSEVHVLPGAHHSWDDRQASGKTGTYGEIMLYDGTATDRSRELVRDFLARHLGAVKPQGT